MSTALTAALVVAAAVGAAAALRGPLRRRRALRQLEGAGSEVAAAVADGRLSPRTGEALLQHLEGLRRSIAEGGEG